MEDKCNGCIRNDPDMKYKMITCPSCKEETYECYLDGRSYVRNCTKCGDGYVSFSYYGNCEMKKEMYEYILNFANVSEEGIKTFCERYDLKIITLL